MHFRLLQLGRPVASPSFESLPHELNSTPGDAQHNLLRYLFSPSAVQHHRWRYSDIECLQTCQQGCSDLWEEDGGKVWIDSPSKAHLQLEGGDLDACVEGADWRHLADKV